MCVPKKNQSYVCVRDPKFQMQTCSKPIYGCRCWHSTTAATTTAVVFVNYDNTYLAENKMSNAPRLFTQLRERFSSRDTVLMASRQGLSLVDLTPMVDVITYYRVLISSTVIDVYLHKLKVYSPLLQWWT